MRALWIVAVYTHISTPLCVHTAIFASAEHASPERGLFALIYLQRILVCTFLGVHMLLCVFRRDLTCDLSLVFSHLSSWAVKRLEPLSRLFARYLKRGVSDTGKVANDVEVEQVRPFPKIPAK